MCKFILLMNSHFYYDFIINLIVLLILCKKK